MKNKKISFIMVLCQVVSYFYIGADTISLCDGRYLSGDTSYLSDYVYFKTDSKSYKINISDVDFLNFSGNVDDISDTTIFITRKDGIKISGKLLRVTNHSITLIRKIDGKIVELPFSQVLTYKTNMFYKKELKSYEKYILLDYDNINNVISELVSGLNKTNLQNYYNTEIPLIKMEDNDFYDQIWNLVSIYLNEHQKELAWDLLDMYLEIEKMYFTADSEQTEPIKVSIAKIRKDFIYRLKKTIVELD